MPGPELVYFKPKEFRNYGNMDPQFLAFLDEARRRAGTAWFLTSDYRDPVHNESAGGWVGSLHTQGRAVDFYTMVLASRIERLWPELAHIFLCCIDARDAMFRGREYGVEFEIIPWGNNRHYHVGLTPNAKPDEFIIARA